MGKSRAKFIFFLLATFIGLNTWGQNIPQGAAALGFTNCVINDSPTAAEIAPGTNGNFKWFSNSGWWVAAPAITNYSTISNVLALNYTGTNLDLAGIQDNYTAGALPLLAGSNGFYIEFDVQLSDNNKDHWAAVWLMPQEHNPYFIQGQYEDHYSGTPSGYEQWMELDVQESGWTSGLLGTVHYWNGIWPNTSSISNPNNGSTNALDMSLKHTFGASYDPIHQQVAWWVDGVFQMSAKAPYVPAIAIQQYFYPILSTYSHGQNIPYSMYVGGVRAYVGPATIIAPPTNLHAVLQ